MTIEIKACGPGGRVSVIVQTDATAHSFLSERPAAVAAIKAGIHAAVAAALIDGNLRDTVRAET